MAIEDSAVHPDKAEDEAETTAAIAEESAADELHRRCAEVNHDSGEECITTQHKRGKLTARERIDYFPDDGTFCEIGLFVEHRSTNFGIEGKQYAGDGLVTGYGKVDGRPTRSPAVTNGKQRRDYAENSQANG